MFTKEPFYFSSIRKYVILFGTLFNNIKISRTDNTGKVTSLMKVPIGYGPKEKMLTRVIQDPNIDRQTAIQLPIMSFEITGFNYDGDRKRQTVHRIASLDASSPDKNKYQYSPVPYNIGFSLSIYVKNAEDGTKIVEQILPYFTPDLTTTVNLIPEMDVKMDIPLVLNRVSTDDTYTGDFKDRRALLWNLDFTMKGYLFGPVKKSGVIKYIDVNMYVPAVEDLLSGVGNSDPVATIAIQPGLLANGSPTTNSSLSVPVSQIKSTDDYGFVIGITEN
jgi:hypothetical protein